MTVWLLGILGVGIVDMLVVHFTEHTRIHKSIKTVCSIIFVFAIVYPLPGLVNGTLSFDSLSISFDIELDEYIYDIISDSEIDAIEMALENALEYDGYIVEVSLNAEIVDGELCIYEVQLYGENYSEVIVEKVCEYLVVDKEVVYFDVSN